MVPAAALGTPAAQQSGNFFVSVAGTAVGSVPHQIDLKVTQLPGGQLSEVSGFIVSPEDVVQVKQGENLIVSTSSDLRTHQVTVRNIQGIPIDLVPLPSNAWSLQGLLPGVYTLNVNVAMSSSGILGTYETILVILTPDQQPLPPTTVINQITIRQPGCPPNYTYVNGTCVGPSPPPPPPCDPEVEVCPPPPPPPPCDPEVEVCVCPEGTTGTPPNCVPEECPEGTTGTPPNCQSIEEEGGDGGIGGGGLFNGEGGEEGSGEEGSGEEGSGGNGDVPSQFG